MQRVDDEARRLLSEAELLGDGDEDGGHGRRCEAPVLRRGHDEEAVTSEVPFPRSGGRGDDRSDGEERS